MIEKSKPKMVLKISGTAYSKEEYFFKKKHPLRWKFRQFLKRLIRLVNGSSNKETVRRSTYKPPDATAS
jgi:hypothetical protein